MGLHPAVFETAIIPFRRIRRRWRLLPPLDQRVLRHQVKNVGNLLPGNRGDVQAWAFVVRGRLWTRMGGRAAFGAGWPGMVPAIAGTVYGAAYWRHGVPPANSPADGRAAGQNGAAWHGAAGMVPPIGGTVPGGAVPGGTVYRRAIARRRKRGGGCGAHLMPRHIHGHPADPPYRLSYSRAPSRTPSGIGLLAFHSQWHSRLAERIFSVLSRQRSPWPPAKLARGGSNDGRNRWQRKDRLRNRNVAK